MGEGEQREHDAGDTAYDVVCAVDEDDSRAVFEVYDEVWGDQPDYAAWRSGIWDRHVVREGFRLVRAHVGVDGDRRLVGFGYGYTGRPGQWWTDQVARVLGPEMASAWLGGHFELVSIGVTQHARRRGVGRVLMERLCDGLPQQRWVLMTTANADDPARHLYARLRWEVLGPGLRDGQVIMGRRR